MFAHWRVACASVRVCVCLFVSRLERAGACVHLRQIQYVLRLGSGLHVCDQNKQGFKGQQCSGDRGGWEGRDIVPEEVCEVVLVGMGGVLELGLDGRQRGSSSPPGS